MSRCARCFGEVHDLAVFCPGCSQPHTPAFEQLLNQVIGERYQIYRRLDKGGLSAVFTAIDLPTDQIVVVKLSDPSHLTKRELTYELATAEARRYWAEMLERMRREAEALTQIRHPNIVRLYDTGTLGDELRYVVMEYLPGRTLRAELAARQKLPLQEALAIGIALAEALREIHTRGIVHRDLNPRNVMFAERGSRNAESKPATATATNSALRTPHSALIKLIDFGIAKFPQPPGAPPFTQHSVLSGTVAYASPEQCQNQPLDQRADIYSLGIVLYEMLTGERPFTGRTPTEIALKQIQAAPPAPRTFVPELPLSLERTLLRALAKNPAERQQRADELAEELLAIAQRVVVTLPEKSADTPLPLMPLPGVTPSHAVQPVTTGAEPDKPLFTAYPATPHRQRRWIYAAALLLLLTGAALLAKNQFAKRRSLPTDNETALTSPTATPLSASFESATPAASASPVTATPAATPLPAPETQMLLARAALTSAQPVNRENKAASVSRVAVASNSKPSVQPITAANARAPLPGIPLPGVTDAPVPAPVVRDPQVYSAPEPASAPPVPTPIDSVAEAEPPRAITATRARRQRETKSESEASHDSEPPRGVMQKVNSVQSASEEAEARHDFAPKVIAWSGAVRGERVIRLEMPGVPGRIEVPRSYRNRVGVVEEPQWRNGWRLAVLRVFGRGECSIILRWWPR